ncbi:MAG: hypothetical protein CBE07_001385 [Pelagibacteraceae bacterium TMED247]|mgnify:CR=1 FL=1|nr:MAG: hypothetical protein CBE07_001385 [Pelagibacteraceae bacterium TMED247]|tara:strand:+ start:96 stop:782 length:687 start_codon:yes stop_codon:yes gene_type:complete
MRRKLAAKRNYLRKISSNDFGDVQIEETRGFAEHELMEELEDSLREAESIARSITQGTGFLKSPSDPALISEIANILVDGGVVKRISELIESAPHMGPEDFPSEREGGPGYGDLEDPYSPFAEPEFVMGDDSEDPLDFPDPYRIAAKRNYKLTKKSQQRSPEDTAQMWNSKERSRMERVRNMEAQHQKEMQEARANSEMTGTFSPDIRNLQEQVDRLEARVEYLESTP